MRHIDGQVLKGNTPKTDRFRSQILKRLWRQIDILKEEITSIVWIKCGIKWQYFLLMCGTKISFEVKSNTDLLLKLQYLQPTTHRYTLKMTCIDCAAVSSPGIKENYKQMTLYFTQRRESCSSIRTVNYWPDPITANIRCFPICFLNKWVLLETRSTHQNSVISSLLPFANEVAGR